MKNYTNNGIYYEDSDFVLNVRDFSMKRRVKNFVIRLLYPIRNLYFKILVNLIRNYKEIRTKYNVVICSIFKDEAPFLKEFIEYHKMLGVDHFYLYNNFSTDNYKEVLKPYIDKGIVTLTEWPVQSGQIPAYEHWKYNYKKDSKWVSFLDLDEFICPVYDYDIVSWLNRYKKYPVLLLDWVMFTSSGLLEHDCQKLVIEQYTQCWHKRGRKGKLFMNCRFDYNEDTSMMHYLKVKFGSFKILPFNASGNIVDETGFQYVNKKQYSIQCNHYYCKAYDRLHNKISRGSAVYKTSWKKLEIYWPREMNGINRDYTIQRFLLKLKVILNY